MAIQQLEPGEKWWLPPAPKPELEPMAAPPVPVIAERLVYVVAQAVPLAMHPGQRMEMKRWR